MATARDIDVSSLTKERTIYERFDAVASRNPDAICFVDAEDNRVFTFHELGILSRQAANFLASLGVQRGDNAVLWLPNCVEWVALHIALCRIGANTVGLNTRFRTEEMRHFFKTAAPSVVVAQGGFLDTDYIAMAEESRSDPRMKIVNLAGKPSSLPDVIHLSSFSSFPESGCPATGRPEDLAISYTTSGTTGFPKLATHDQIGLLIHLLLIAGPGGMGMKEPVRPSTAGESRRMRPLEQDAMLVTVPVCGTFGYNLTMAPMLGPGCAAISARFYTPESANFFAEAWSVTHIAAPDIVIDGLIESIGKPATFTDANGTLHKVTCSFPRWRHALYPNFAALAESVTNKLATRFPRITGVNCYGSSEVMGGIAAWTGSHPLDVRVKNGGRLISDDETLMRVRVADMDTDEEVAEGEPGEIQIHSIGIIQCYLNNPEATKKAMTVDKEGRVWYKTGDLGHLLDPRSFIFLGRMGDTLRVRGYLTNPEDIEKALLLHPRVHTAQVVGVQVEGLGDVPIGFVSLKDTEGDKLSLAEQEKVEEAMMKLCRENLAAYKVPAKVHLVSEWPMTVGTNGQKIQKAKLREIAKDRGFVAPKKLGTSKGTAASRL